jgi:ABC-2 type transport system permease protein
MTLRRGETLLVTIGIPVVFLVFFSEVHVLPTGHESAVSFVVPGVLALSVMSTAMVSLGIATGFERGYGWSGPRSSPSCWSSSPRRSC